MTADRREVHCLSASLSEHDFESVGGASPLAGLRRTVPSWEKKARPESRESGTHDEAGGAGISHGAASSWAAIVSSMLASPHGASEQYMCTVTPSFKAKG